jgi:hypothetical protein
MRGRIHRRRCLDHKGEHADWGVLGLSYRGDGVAVVSSFRMHAAIDRAAVAARGEGGAARTRPRARPGASERRTACLLTMQGLDQDDRSREWELVSGRARGGGAVAARENSVRPCLNRRHGGDGFHVRAAALLSSPPIALGVAAVAQQVAGRQLVEEAAGQQGRFRPSACSAQWLSTSVPSRG